MGDPCHIRVRQPTPISLTIGVSVVAHVALFASARWLPARVQRTAEPPVRIELVPPTPTSEPPAIDVVFVDSRAEPEATAAVSTPVPAPTTRPSRARAGGSTAPAAPATAAISTDTPAAVELPGAADHPPARNPYLDMRRAPSPQVAVRGWDDLEHVPQGTAPEPEVATGQLAPDGGGRHRSDQGAFVAQVDKDGTVKFRDKRNFNIHLALPSAKDIGDLIQTWYDDPNKSVGTLGPPNQPQRRTDLTRDDVAGAERLYGNDTGALALDKGPNPGDGGGIPIAAGGFDLTDAFMRGRGSDPYASKKLAFLDSTRDERVRIGRQHRSEQLAQVAPVVRANLARVWSATTDPRQRKQALFEMWDECEETGSEEVVQAAATARALIVAFIRTHVPASGPDAYTAAELAACNRAKRSVAPFAPYQ